MKTIVDKKRGGEYNKQNKMLEQAKVQSRFQSIARDIVTEDRKLARRPGIFFYLSLTDIPRIKRNILSWSAGEQDEGIRRDNQKQYLLGPQCFKDLLRLLAVNDPILGELGINDEELKTSLDKGIDFRQDNALKKIRYLLFLSAKPESGISPEIFYRVVRFYTEELDGLRKLRTKLLSPKSPASIFSRLLNVK